MKNVLKLFLLLIIVVAGVQTSNAQPKSEDDHAYPEITEKQRKIIPYDHIREADVFWRKRIWRKINTREKVNLPFIYPKRQFVKVLFDAIMADSIKAYDESLGEEFPDSAILDKSFLDKLLNRVDTLENQMNIRTGENDTTLIIPNPLRPETITSFEIKEDWIFDENTSTMKVRILGIAPIQDIYKDGEKLGTKKLFWINYPKARQILANAYAFNPANDAVKLSWEEIFESRRFGSFIIKESNVFDRRIESYAPAMAGVLESERIKTEIFRKEHELWSF